MTKPAEIALGGLEFGMEISDYMLWKFVIVVVAAFIAGFMGWLR